MIDTKKTGNSCEFPASVSAEPIRQNYGAMALVGM